MSLIYLDCETTGLDPDRHEIWEIAWAVDNGPIRSAIVPHTLRHADPEALRIGGHERCVCHRDIDHLAENALRDALDGHTLAGANPAFDAAFLRVRWGQTPWRYRLLDVEAYAMGAMGWEEPRGLKDIAFQLDITPGDHTAAGDVACVRECYRALQSHYIDLRM